MIVGVGNLGEVRGLRSGGPGQEGSGQACGAPASSWEVGRELGPAVAMKQGL